MTRTKIRFSREELKVFLHFVFRLAKPRVTLRISAELQELNVYLSMPLRATWPNLLFPSILPKLGTRLFTSSPEYNPFTNALLKAGAKSRRFEHIMRNMWCFLFDGQLLQGFALLSFLCVVQVKKIKFLQTTLFTLGKKDGGCIFYRIRHKENQVFTVFLSAPWTLSSLGLKIL